MLHYTCLIDINVNELLFKNSFSFIQTLSAWCPFSFRVFFSSAIVLHVYRGYIYTCNLINEYIYQYTYSKLMQNANIDYIYIYTVYMYNASIKSIKNKWILIQF